MRHRYIRTVEDLRRDQTRDDSKLFMRKQVFQEIAEEREQARASLKERLMARMARLRKKNKG